jgi:hydrogenase expression/formation protein HypC
MCLGIPGQVVEMVPGHGDQLALVDVAGARRRVNIGLLETGPPAPGQWVLIHMGFVVELVTAEAAEEAMQGLELMGRPRDPEEPAPVEPAPVEPAPVEPAAAESAGR